MASLPDCDISDYSMIEEKFHEYMAKKGGPRNSE